MTKYFVIGTSYLVLQRKLLYFALSTSYFGESHYGDGSIVKQERQGAEVNFCAFGWLFSDYMDKFRYTFS